MTVNTKSKFIAFILLCIWMSPNVLLWNSLSAQAKNKTIPSILPINTELRDIDSAPSPGPVPGPIYVHAAHKQSEAPAVRYERKPYVIEDPFAGGDLTPPSGLAVVMYPYKPNWVEQLKALHNPCISGAAAQINWCDIEAERNEPDWSRLDDLFSAAEIQKKWVHLIISPGFFSPDWAKIGVQTDKFAIQSGPGKGTITKLPMPWDETYLVRWFAFLKQLGKRYSGSSAFKVISAAGPTSVSTEFTLPDNPKDHKQWINDKYTPEKYKKTWQQVFRVYSSCFPNQYISLSSPGLPFPAPGGKDLNDRKRFRREIVEQAYAIFGIRLALQWSDLHATSDQSAPKDEYRDFLISHNGRICTGMQLKTSAELNSADMGAEKNPPLALRRSIYIGMQPNDLGKHISYLEISEPDVVAEDMQPVLRYAAEKFK